MKVLCAQMFFKEFDIFEIKLNELRGVVDQHLVVEFTTTQIGLSKPLYFEENKTRYKGWPITHVTFDRMIAGSPRDIETGQRQLLMEEIDKLHPDVVIYADADEVPRAASVRAFLEGDRPAANLVMDNVWWCFDRLAENCPQNDHPIIMRYPLEGFKPHPRVSGQFPRIENAGWHFEFFGSREDVLEKINATAHAPEWGSRHTWRSVYAGKAPGELKLTPYPLDKLPQYVLDNRKRFARYFKPTQQ